MKLSSLSGVKEARGPLKTTSASQPVYISPWACLLHSFFKSSEGVVATPFLSNSFFVQSSHNSLILSSIAGLFSFCNLSKPLVYIWYPWLPNSTAFSKETKNL